MRRTLHPALQKVAALALLGVALGAGVSAIAYPLVEARNAHAEAVARLAKYRQVLDGGPDGGAIYDPADLAAVHVDDAEAQLALQAAIDRLARGVGVTVQSLEPMAAEHLGDLGRGVWVEMAFTGDLQALTQFLSGLETESPMLLVRRVELDGGQGLRPDIALRVKAQVGRAWRAGEEPA